MTHASHRMAVTITMVISDEEWKCPQSELQVEYSETSSRFSKLSNHVFISEELGLQTTPLSPSRKENLLNVFGFITHPHF